MKNKTKFLLTTLFILVAFLLLGTTNVNAATLVKNEAELRNAVSGSDSSITEVKLTDDIEITDSDLGIWVVNDLTLDLCGNTINGNVSTNKKSIYIQYGKNSSTSGSLTIKDSGSSAGSIKSFNNITVGNSNSDTSSEKNYSLIIENGQLYAQGGTWSNNVFYLHDQLANKNVTFNFQVKDGYFENGNSYGSILVLDSVLSNANINLNINFDKLTFYSSNALSNRLIYTYNTAYTTNLSDVVSDSSEVVLKRTQTGATAKLTDLNVSATSPDPLNSVLEYYSTIEVIKTEGFDVSNVTLNETYGFTSETATAVEIPIKNRGTSNLKIKNVTVNDSNFKILNGSETNLSAGATDTTWKVQANASLPKGTYTATITVEDEAGKTYTSTVTLTVGAKPLTGISIFVPNEITYGNTYTPTPNFGEITGLSADDYTITFAKKNGETYTDIDYTPSDVGEYRAILKVTNENYIADDATVDFKIVAKTITPTVSDIADEQYTGEQITPDVIVSCDSEVLEKDTDYTVEYDTNKAIGEGKVTIKAVSGRNYTFADIEKTFNIVARTLTDGDVTLTQTSYRYTGSEIKPQPDVKVGDKTLVAGTDYELSYSDNTEKGNNTAKVTVTGKGNYTGAIDIYFSIIDKDPQVIYFEVTDITKTYGDSDFTITAKHTTGDGTLTYTSTNTDVATVNETTGKVTIKKAGTTTIKVTASSTTDFAEETAEYTLTVEKKELSYTATVDNKAFDNKKTATVSGITFTGLVGSESLTKDTDYTVSAEFASASVGNNIDVNVTVTLKDTDITKNYTLASTSSTVKANITGKEIVESGVTVDTDTTYTYSGSEIKPNVIVKDGTTTLTEGTDYTVEYSNNINAGTGKVKVTGTGNYSGVIEKEFTINKLSISPTIENIPAVTYNGNEQKPELVVKYGTTTLVKDRDYTVEYTDNTNAGEADAEISEASTSNYTFTTTGRSFTINKYTITSSDITLEYTSIKADGTEKRPNVTVKMGTTEISSLKYNVDYSNNIAVGTADVKVTIKEGDTNFTGSATVHFDISPKTVLDITGMNNNQTITYTGSPVVLVGTLQVDNGFTANDLIETWYNEAGTDEISKPTNVGKYQVVYSYEDDDFEGYEIIFVEITKKDSIVPSVDTYKGIAGEKLSTITLPNGFKWDDGNQSILVGNGEYTASYTTNNDTTNYTTTTATIEVYGKTKVNLTTSVNGDIGGTISSNKSNILEDTTETIIFTPNTGYEISKVEVNGVDKTSSVVDNKLDVVVGTNNINVVVTYKVIQYTITINGVANATIDPSGVIKVDYNTNKEFTIKADAGYKLVSVKVNGVERKSDIVNDKLTLENILANAEIVVVVEKNVYEVTEGANQKYTITKNSEAKFRINADYSKFENGGKVYVDGELVDAKNYTSKSGSTVITLKQAYVDTLSVGEHTLKVVFNDGGEATTNFTIAKVAEQTTTNVDNSSNPKTFDNIMVYVAIAIMSVVGFGATVVIRKKQAK